MASAPQPDSFAVNQNSAVNYPALLRHVKRALKTPIGVLQIFYCFATDYRRLFTDVLKSKWPSGVHPITFALLMYGLSALVFSFSSGTTEAITWLDVFDNLSPDAQATFLTDFDLGYANQSDYIMALRIEMDRPGRSDLSDRIRRVVGSTRASDVGYYLKGHDPVLGDAFVNQLEALRKKDTLLEHESNSPWFVMLVLLVSCMGPILLFLRRPDVSAMQTFYVLLIINGYTIGISFLLGAVDWWTNSHWAVSRVQQFAVLGLVALLLGCYFEVMLYKVLKFTHQAGFWRVTVFQFTSFLTSILLTVVLIRPVSEWLTHLA